NRESSQPPYAVSLPQHPNATGSRFTRSLDSFCSLLLWGIISFHILSTAEILRRDLSAETQRLQSQCFLRWIMSVRNRNRAQKRLLTTGCRLTTTLRRESLIVFK